MNIFKELVLSIYNFKSYQKFLDNRKTKVFGFGIVLMLIYFTITTVAPLVKFIAVDGGIGQLVEESIPDFELENGSLWVEDVVEYEGSGNYIYIDTDPNYFLYGADEMTELLYDYSGAILMDSEKIIVKDEGVVQELYYSDLDIDFSKTDLMEFVPYAYIIIAIYQVIAYLFKTATFFFGVLFIALIGMIVASCMKYQLTFGQLYLIGIYSRTLPLLIKAILSLLSIDLFVFINFGISLIIIACAIQKMKEGQLQQPLEFASNDIA